VYGGWLPSRSPNELNKVVQEIMRKVLGIVALLAVALAVVLVMAGCPPKKAPAVPEGIKPSGEPGVGTPTTTTPQPTEGVKAPEETKPGETAPTEGATAPAETKPGEPAPAEGATVPAPTRPGETKPGEPKPGG